MNRAAIRMVSSYLPEPIVTNEEIEDKVRIGQKTMASGTLRKLFGSESRRAAPRYIQVSDLASEAARNILTQVDKISIDLLIFAAASSDLIEPATGNIIQSKLGLTCPVMDIKNACNSFVTAMQTASSFIEAGFYKNVLIVNGEKLSEVINFEPNDNEHFKRCLSGYTLGDAGAAMLLGLQKDHQIVYQKFCTWGKYWNLCTVEGGGSMAFRDFKKYYFESDTNTLNAVVKEVAPQFITDCLAEAGILISNVATVVTHQISSPTTAKIAEILTIPLTKFIQTFREYGNIGAATIPVALHQAIQANQLKKGDIVLILGFAAGISISVQIIIW